MYTYFFSSESKTVITEKSHVRVYNDRNELTNSDRYQGTEITDLSIPVDPEKRVFAYDPIGNRNSAIEGTDDKTYSVNELNQYTGITGSDSPAYDDDGNMTSASGNNFTYNAENRLIAITPGISCGWESET